MPLIEGPSSSPVMRKRDRALRRAVPLDVGERSGDESGDGALHVRGAAADRSRPSAISAAKGIVSASVRHRRAARRRYVRRRRDAARLTPILAKRLSTSGVPGAVKTIRCVSKPAAFSAFSTTSSAPASAGVTDGQRMSSRVSETARRQRQFDLFSERPVRCTRTLNLHYSVRSNWGDAITPGSAATPRSRGGKRTTQRSSRHPRWSTERRRQSASTPRHTSGA